MDSETEDNIYTPQVSQFLIPQTGQTFTSIDDALAHYNQYARVAGFSTRTCNGKKKKGTNEYVWKLFVCYKQGTTNENYHLHVKNSVSRTGERNRGHTRCGCNARLSIVKEQTGEWAVSQFVEEHNHPLTTPSRVHLLRSHRTFSTAKKALAEQFSEANIPTCQQVRLFQIDSGGPSTVGFEERDVRNHERNIRHEKFGKDAQSLIEHFMFERDKNPNFFFEYEVDDENNFTRCFWADSESRRSYAYFGDVVVFDTTYNTNKYSLVFAPFVGVNHHGQSIVFGCGFLSQETVDSFLWLFTKFVEAMPTHAPPGVIITDQDAAMSKAISRVMPFTLHRYCVWHILNKFPEKMNVSLNNAEYHLLVKIIKQSESPEEFEVRWNEVMETTTLSSNEWLQTMFELREKWVPAYVNHVFSAGMSSSQRSESGHSFLKKYVNRKHSLIEFISRFNRALEHQRHTELAASHTDLNEIPRLTSVGMMEHQMAQIYTKKIFLLWQKEFEQSNFYLCTRASITAVAKTYSLQRFGVEKTCDRERVVTYFPASDYVSCSCRMFEFHGYPCRHILCYMKKKQVLLLPDNYILKRWTKNAKAALVFDNVDGLLSGDSTCTSLMARHGMLVHTAFEIIDEASLTEARFTYLMREFQNLRVQVKSIDVGGNGGSSRDISRLVEETIDVHDPKPVRAKGCGKRLKSSRERAMTRPPRQCRGCGNSGHDRRTCPVVNMPDNSYNPQYANDNLDDDSFDNAFDL